MKNLAALKALGNKDFVKSGSRVAGRIGLATKHYSPQILLGAGIVGVTTATILACKATLELDNVLAHNKIQRQGLEKKTHELTADQYSSIDHKREMTKIYIATGKELTKLYAIPVSIGIVSIGCLVGGQGILHKRNVAVIAAYKGLEETFNKYRERVIADHGEEKDRDYRMGVSHTTEKGEDGKNHRVQVLDANSVGSHVKIFDKHNKHWSNSPDYNLNTVQVLEEVFNEKLRRIGHVFLNDVLNELGFEETRAGAVCGWIYEGGNGDGHISFDIKDLQGEGSRVAGVDDEVDCLLLDFNHDGVILDFLPEK